MAKDGSINNLMHQAKIKMDVETIVRLRFMVLKSLIQWKK